MRTVFAGLRAWMVNSEGRPVVSSSISAQFECGRTFHAQADVTQNFETGAMNGFHLVGGDDLHRRIGITEWSER